MTASDTVLVEAIAAVAAACGVARAVRAAVGGPGTIAKSDASPVTVADFAVQAIVAARLEAALKGKPLHLVGEESAGMLRSPGRHAELDAVVEAVQSVESGLTESEILRAIDLGDHDPRGGGFWTLDPIDGTKGFIRGGQYSVCLARIDHGEVVAAVLGCPNLEPAGWDPDRHPSQGSILVAERGAGCWQVEERTPQAPGRRLHRAPLEPGRPILFCESVEAGPQTRARMERIVDGAGLPWRGLRLDSQVKYALVARGEADVYLRVPRRSLPVESIWDHASGTLCVAEAGGAVSDLDGRPLDFGRGRLLGANRGIVASAAELHAALLAGARSVQLDPFAAM